LEKSFLQDYLAFEENLQLALAYLRAEMLDWEIDLPEGEDIDRERLAAILKGNRALAIAQGLCRYRFEIIEEMKADYEPFSFSQLLAYLLQLQLAEEWRNYENNLVTYEPPSDLNGHLYQQVT
jgi:hypothetical protein